MELPLTSTFPKLKFLTTFPDLNGLKINPLLFTIGGGSVVDDELVVEVVVDVDVEELVVVEVLVVLVVEEVDDVVDVVVEVDDVLVEDVRRRS